MYHKLWYNYDRKKKVMVQTTRQYSMEEPKEKGKKPKRMSS